MTAMPSRLRGRLQHERISGRDQKLSDPNPLERPPADIGQAWRDWLASERERRGRPNWQPF